jgi:hypothetical protein
MRYDCEIDPNIIIRNLFSYTLYVVSIYALFSEDHPNIFNRKDDYYITSLAHISTSFNFLLKLRKGDHIVRI